MNISFVINPLGGTPVYKQLVQQFESKINSGRLEIGALVPSMNELAAELNISRETVKKVYAILRDRGYLEPHQGKGFYVADPHNGDRKPRVLILFDKLSIYKQTLLNSFLDEIGEGVNATILLHNQDLSLYEYYLNLYLDQFDYYIVTPHFALDEESRRAALKLTARIPNRKLILLDHLPEGLKGNFGAVYQDFSNDAFEGLKGSLSKLKKSGNLNVLTLPSSLYGEQVCRAVDRFCSTHSINVSYYLHAPQTIKRGDTFLLINSQLDSEISDLADKIKQAKLRIGKDVFIISYNEFPLNRVVLGGLTTISTDFAMMGRLAAQMILQKRMFKRKCEFGMIRRATF